MKNNEKMELMEINNNSIWNKIKNWFNRLKRNFIHTKNINLDNPNIENIGATEKETDNEIILKARLAYKNYILNSEYELGKKIYKLIKERITVNKEQIEKLIEINKEATTYNEILELLDKEEKSLQEYKRTNVMSKIDNKFMFSQYQVPVGIIAIETNDAYTAIQNILRAIGTRNAIVEIEKNYNEHSIENLILVIVKEAIKKFKIDENIIQIVDKQLISTKDLNEFDIVILEDGEVINKEQTDKMYIYKEDEYFADIVENEAKKLRLSGKNVEIISGEMEKCIKEINENTPFAVCIYTKDRKKAYKFINLVNSENVFFNGTLLNAKKNKKLSNIYLTLKNLVYEYGII